MREAVLAWAVQVQAVMRMLDGGDPQAMAAERREQPGHQRGLAAA
jgi:hypothetical protein